MPFLSFTNLFPLLQPNWPCFSLSALSSLYLRAFVLAVPSTRNTLLLDTSCLVPSLHAELSPNVSIPHALIFAHYHSLFSALLLFIAFITIRYFIMSFFAFFVSYLSPPLAYNPMSCRNFVSLTVIISRAMNSAWLIVDSLKFVWGNEWTIEKGKLMGSSFQPPSLSCTCPGQCRKTKFVVKKEEGLIGQKVLRLSQSAQLPFSSVLSGLRALDWFWIWILFKTHFLPGWSFRN